MQRLEPDRKVTVLRTETYFQRDTHDQVLITNAEDFFVMNNSMFATRKAFSGSLPSFCQISLDIVSNLLAKIFV